MLTVDILNALKQYTADMKNDITLVVQAGEHEKKAELLDLLEKFSTVSNRISVSERDTQGALRSPVSFMLEVDGKPNGITFSGIPGGHEFNSLVLAVLHSSGTPIKLDQSLQNLIKGFDQQLKFEVFVSLSCHNCPEVVQSLNQLAALNPAISCETIDGGVYPELVEQNNIQGVPTVFLNGEVFANGKIDTAQILEKILEQNPSSAKPIETEKLPLQDVTIIGGGPAGTAAAIYSARKGLSVTLITDRIGGQVKETMGIENMISIPKTTGPELANNLQEHLSDYEITIKENFKVNKVENGDVKKIHLSTGEVIESKTIIIATGAKWRELGIPGEKENVGSGVAYCPHCDGPFFKGKDVAVIGGGNSGVEAALDLAGIVKSVTLFEFLPELKADRVLVEQAEKRDNITILKNVTTKQILAEGGKVNAIEYQDRESEQVSTRDLSGVFVQIGLVPNSEVFKGVVDLTQQGEVVINEKGQTSTKGIFACGDVTTVPYKQIVIAMGEGAKASLAAFDYLLQQG